MSSTEIIVFLSEEIWTDINIIYMYCTANGEQAERHFMTCRV